MQMAFNRALRCKSSNYKRSMNNLRKRLMTWNSRINNWILQSVRKPTRYNSISEALRVNAFRSRRFCKRTSGSMRSLANCRKGIRSWVRCLVRQCTCRLKASSKKSWERWPRIKWMVHLTAKWKGSNKRMVIQRTDVVAQKKERILFGNQEWRKIGSKWVKDWMEWWWLKITART